VNSLFLCYRKQRTFLSSDTKNDDARNPPQPAGRKVHVHRIFSLTLARRAFGNGSSISLSGNLHPQLTSRNSPLYFGRSDFALSRIRWSSALSLNLRKPENSQRLTFSLSLSDFSLSRFRRSRCQATCSRDSRNPIYRNSDALASFDLSTAFHSVGTSDFAISRILMQRIRNFTPRNPEMVNGKFDSMSIVRHLSTCRFCGPHNPFALRDFAFHDFASPVAKFRDFHSRKPEIEVHG
jgi:hypothetical protein